MLPYKNRIHTKTDLETVFKARKSLKRENITFWYSLHQTEENRFAVIITTKFSKLAVARNRLRRQIRAVVKNLLPYLNKKTQGIFFVSSRKKGMTNRKIKETIVTIFNDLNIIKK